MVWLGQRKGVGVEGDWVKACPIFIIMNAVITVGVTQCVRGIRIVLGDADRHKTHRMLLTSCTYEIINGGEWFVLM